MIQTVLAEAGSENEHGMFDTIAGLPIHPLTVHVVVVLIPLAALGVIALNVVPRWRRGYDLLATAALVIGGVATFVAKESGEELAGHVGLPANHAQWGDRFFAVAGLFCAVSLIWLVLARRAKDDVSTTVRGLGALASVLAVATLVVAILVGHSGAQAVWGDQVSAALASVAPLSS